MELLLEDELFASDEDEEDEPDAAGLLSDEPEELPESDEDEGVDDVVLEFEPRESLR